MSKKSNFSAKRLAIDGLLAAMFFGLAMFSVRVGGLKLTFDSLAVVVAAMLFGPVDAFLVGFVGAFLEQMVGFGFTATTLLWILPPALRGVWVGLAVVLFKKAMSLETVLGEKKPYVYFAACIGAAILTSVGNTLAYYVDAKIYHYYTYELIFGVFGIRILTGIVSAVITAVVALPILAALKKIGITRVQKPAENQ